MNCISVILAVVCLGLAPHVVHADDPPVEHLTLQLDQLPERLLPQYLPCVVDGTRYACYSEEQQVQLNELEVSARGWYRRAQLSDALRLNLGILVINLHAQLAEASRIQGLQRTRVESLEARVATEIRAKNEYRAEAESTDVWPLLVGGGLVLVAVGVLIAVLVDRD